MQRRTELNKWVKAKHRGQLIKFSGEPYYDHVAAVADMAAYAAVFGYEIGLCHDLIEKTSTSAEELNTALMGFGYLPGDASAIVSQVIELTDVFTKAAYPDMKKAMRKEKEEHRLLTISSDAQTVKYADLIYNIKWMMEYEAATAAPYLIRKKKLLLNMDAGNAELRNKAIKIAEQALSMLL